MKAKKRSTRVLAYQFRSGDLDSLRELVDFLIRAKQMFLPMDSILEILKEKREEGDWLILDLAEALHHQIVPNDFFRRAYIACDGSKQFFKNRSL